MKKLFFLCFFAVFSLLARAQNVEQTLARFDQQADAATANAFFDALMKEKFIDDPIVFASSAPVDSMRQQVCYWAAEWMYDQEQYKDAERYALEALPKYHPSNPEKADCLNLLGCIYVRLGDFKQAANYARQCVEIDEQSGDHDRIASSMNTLAGIYMAGYQAKEAEPIILQAIEHINQVDNPGRKAVILGMASEIYHTLGDDAKALPYAEEAVAIEQQLGRQPKMAIRLSQKGSALLGLHRYKEAEDIYRQILPDLKASGDLHAYAIALNRLGMSLLCQKRQQDAIPYYKEAAMSGLILQFAFTYTDQNRSKLSTIANVKDMETYLKRQNILEQFVVYADKNGLKRRNLMIQKSQKLLERFVISRIIYNIHSEQSWTEYLNQDDPVIIETLRLFHNEGAFPQKPVAGGKGKQVAKASDCRELRMLNMHIAHA